MISLSSLDAIIIILFFLLVLAAGFIPAFKFKKDPGSYLLSGRTVGLFLFVLTNVSTWYGGILGVGEFTYRYGIMSWFTQGLPYYIFAIIFAFTLAPKIRKASLFTIPDKLEQSYGRVVGIASSILVFLLVSPAPYLLMIGIIISNIFNIPLFWSLIISLVISIAYLFRGGYTSDLYTDAFEFFVMFIGFIILFIVSYNEFGGLSFLKSELPPNHLKLTGDVSFTYILVWFFIALWTFADPGFHQRCYAAKNEKVAKYGIIISVLLWGLFDFLTTSTGLYAKAHLTQIENPVLAFPYYAESILGPGLKGIFYAGMLATILSTLNSFLFLSGSTFGRDFYYKISAKPSEQKIIRFTRVGLIVSGFVSVIMAYYFESVIELWYVIGSLCIPGLIVLVIGSYYPKYLVTQKFAITELICAVTGTASWYFIRKTLTDESALKVIEPMLIGFIMAVGIHTIGVMLKREAGANPA